VIRWTDHVKKIEVLYGDKKERNKTHSTKRSKTNWIGHILRRNCLLNNVIAGKIEGTGRRARGRKQLLEVRKEK
jgi:hypothetical protein